jgi:hypothetical protein
MSTFDTWREQFVESAGYSLRIEDLRERAIRCDTPLSFKKQVGITYVKEPMIQRTIFEIMSSMSWEKKSFELERPYDPKASGNTPRADFALKDPESKRGRTWNYIEMKKYNTDHIRGDIEKLANVGSGRSNKNHMLIYRTTSKNPSEKSETYLLSLLKKSFPDDFHYTGIYGPVEHDFKTLVPKKYSNPNSEATPGKCEIVLVTVKRRKNRN